MDDKFASDYANQSSTRQNVELCDEKTQSEANAALSDIKVEASGVLNLHQVFDVANLYKSLNRSKRSETELNIMSCQFSPRKDFMALALSTGEVEVMQYNQEDGSLRICYTLLDRDVNEAYNNCTCLSWLPDGKKILATYTNGILKMWHVASKNALLTRDENEVTQPGGLVEGSDIVREVFSKPENSRSKFSIPKKRPTLVTLKDQVKGILSPRGKERTGYSANFVPDQSETTPVEKKDEREKERRKTASTVDEAVNEEKYLYQVIIVATGGSDGVIVLWFLTEPSFLSKETAYAANISGRKGRQLLFHRNCVHGGHTKSMDGHMMKIFAVRFFPKQPTLFLSGGWDGQVFKWNAVTGQCLLSCKGPVMCSNESMDLDLDIDRPIVLCADHSAGFLDLIDYGDTYNFVVDTRIFLPQERFLMPYAVALVGVDKILVGGSNPNCLRIIDRKVNLNEEEGGHQKVQAPSTSVLIPADAPQARTQGEAIIYGSMDDLPSAISCIALGKEDRMKRQQIVACCGSLIIILSTAVRH